MQWWCSPYIINYMELQITKAHYQIHGWRGGRLQRNTYIQCHPQYPAYLQGSCSEVDHILPLLPRESLPDVVHLKTSKYTSQLILLHKQPTVMDISTATTTNTTSLTPTVLSTISFASSAGILIVLWRPDDNRPATCIRLIWEQGQQYSILQYACMYKYTCSSLYTDCVLHLSSATLPIITWCHPFPLLCQPSLHLVSTHPPPLPLLPQTRSSPPPSLTWYWRLGQQNPIARCRHTPPKLQMSLAGL